MATTARKEDANMIVGVDLSVLLGIHYERSVISYIYVDRHGTRSVILTEVMHHEVNMDDGLCQVRCMNKIGGLHRSLVPPEYETLDFR